MSEMEVLLEEVEGMGDSELALQCREEKRY